MERTIDGVTHVWSIADNAWVSLTYWNHINGRQPKTHGTSGWEGNNPLDGEPDLGAAPTAEYYPPTSLLAGRIILVSYVHIPRS